MLALIDGDILKYRIGFACQHTQWDVYVAHHEDMGRMASFDNKTEMNAWFKQGYLDKEDATIISKVIAEPVENCLHSVKLQIESILEKTEADSYKIYLTGKVNFRLYVADYYKANRKDAPKPIHYDAITEYLIKYWNAEVVDGQEADDALGIEQYKQLSCLLEDVKNGDDKDPEWCSYTVICTIDKDLDNIPGNHYNFVNDDLYWVDEAYANRNFFAQMLSGDTTDNIPGLFEITGERNKLQYSEPLAYLHVYEDMWWYVFDVYVEKFVAMYEDPMDHHMLTEVRKAVWEKLREIGKLLWIRRIEGEVWEPPSLIESHEKVSKSNKIAL